jgi:hypothetical protein
VPPIRKRNQAFADRRKKLRAKIYKEEND